MKSTFTEKISALRAQLGSQLCILGHHYQPDAIIQHCDVTGDSLQLSRNVPDIAATHIVFCGVHFMGESAALLTRPKQYVYLPTSDADCMMALMASGAHLQNVLTDLNRTKKVLPIAYVNTSLGIKAVVGNFGGAVCTSANAETVLAWALHEADTVLFLPDKYLARNTAQRLGIPPKDTAILHLSGSSFSDPAEELLSKKLLIWPGCCPIHAQLHPSMVAAARAAHPGITVYVHPECPPEVVNAADGAGSTSYLIQQATAAAAEGTPICIGTESNLVARLAKRHRNSCDVFDLHTINCPDMNAITEESLLTILQEIANGSAKPVQIPMSEQEPAKRGLTQMLAICAKSK